ncbi:TauD/TfdA family dioxygenase [Dactylosporangium sp. AC04546]|uniref:TauD/TfdA family dioxygenase n=1 Tax=Dactylosporangium sp. AC04546 TaxID=2862460 RepID=UPI001EE06141|nr:TauD/TfdA family dioxygenase [Dactylosporangium sp. AC04546]WVK79081.1 TauD/TfdA family dioxygenase [Dactylosporangium sp. AC04546]
MSTDTYAAAQPLTLEPPETAELGRIAAAVAGTEPRLVDHPDWLRAARRGADAMPARLRQALRQFRRDSGPGGALLLRGFPVEPAALPPTPAVAESVQRAATGPAALLVMTACVLGEPAAFRAEKTGALVQDVVPVPGHEEFQGNAGSVRLSFHNENAFHPHRPDYVLLLCLRADHERTAGLRTAGIREMLPRLDGAVVAALRSPEFVTAPPPSFGAGGGGTEPHPVLSGPEEDPDMRVDLAATAPQTPRAEHALAELGRVFGEEGATVRLAPGELAIVDNRVAAHGRTGFRPRYDGRDRWLQRTFAAADLRRSRAYRPGDGHVLT